MSVFFCVFGHLLFGCIYVFFCFGLSLWLRFLDVLIYERGGEVNFLSVMWLTDSSRLSPGFFILSQWVCHTDKKNFFDIIYHPFVFHQKGLSIVPEGSLHCDILHNFLSRTSVALCSCFHFWYLIVYFDIKCGYMYCSVYFWWLL